MANTDNHPALEAGHVLILALTVSFLLYLTFTAEHRVDTVLAVGSTDRLLYRLHISYIGQIQETRQ